MLCDVGRSLLKGYGRLKIGLGHLTQYSQSYDEDPMEERIETIDKYEGFRRMFENKTKIQ